MCHVGFSINLHSIINSGLIRGQNSRKRQTAFFLPVDLMDICHKDAKVIDLNVPRHAQYLHNAWKKHQDAVYWVDIKLVQRRKKFYKHDRTQSSFTTHSQVSVSRKLLLWRLENSYTGKYMCSSSKDFFSR